ncbi:hypothetical protein Gogos_001945, partial [Gossypium gossypioides]|nr:hypothetical protein [Gossypium gossypioides]
AFLDSNCYVLGSAQASFRTRTYFASSKVNGARTSKLKITWTTKKDKLTNFNSKDLKAIFNNMDPQEFRSISKCTIAPKALTILETTHKWDNCRFMKRLEEKDYLLTEKGAKLNEVVKNHSHRFLGYVGTSDENVTPIAFVKVKKIVDKPGSSQKVEATYIVKN